MALIHILDSKNDRILGTLNSDKGEFFNPIRQDSLVGENKFDFSVNALSEKASLLEKRNRILLKNETGDFSEYIIFYADQSKRTLKNIKADASWIDLNKAKIINPQIIVGTTPEVMANLALVGTEWEVGDVDFTTSKTITIEEYTNPYDLLKFICVEFELEMRFRVAVDGNKVTNRFVDLREKNAEFEGKEIIFGKDLIGVKRIEDSSKIITSLMGVYERSDGSVVTTWVTDDDAFQRWGRNGNNLVDFYEVTSDDDVISTAELNAITGRELLKRINSIVTYEGEAVSIEHVFGRDHERVRLGQLVRIKDTGYTPPLYLEARILELQVDPVEGRIKNYKLGDFVEYHDEFGKLVKAKIKSSLSKLKIGTKNLLRESGFNDTNTIAWSNYYQIYQNDFQGYNSIVTRRVNWVSGNPKHQLIHTVNSLPLLKALSSYTFSAWVYVDSSVPMDTTANVNTISVKFTKAAGGTFETPIINLSSIQKDTWRYVTATGRLQDDIVSTASFFLTLNKNGLVKLNRPKLEIGEKATDYSPAPEDMETRLVKSETSITQTNEMIALKAERSVTDSLTGRVETAEAKLTLTADDVRIKVSEIDGAGKAVGSLFHQTATSILLKAENIDLLGITNVHRELIIGASSEINPVIKFGVYDTWLKQETNKFTITTSDILSLYSSTRIEMANLNMIDMHNSTINMTGTVINFSNALLDFSGAYPTNLYAVFG